MNLDNNYSLEKDTYQWVLTFTKEGELNDKGVPIITKRQSYYPTIKLALKSYCDQVLDPGWWKAVMDQITTLEKKIDDLPEEIFFENHKLESKIKELTK